MGDAKKKRALGAANKEALDRIDQVNFSLAVKHVAEAFTSFSGADCIIYALVSAGLLRQLGVDAVAVAGSAAWRVGAGAGDVINHATELGGALFAPGGGSGGQKAGMFHCWVEANDGDAGVIIDTSTWQFEKKAKMLDAADGMHTSVDFCPPSLWIPKCSAKLLPIHDVLQSYDIGVFAYLRKPELEPIIYPAEVHDEVGAPMVAAFLCYQALQRGERMEVIGVEPDGSVKAEEDRRSGFVPVGMMR